jgi:hypothetical protein
MDGCLEVGKFTVCAQYDYKRMKLHNEMVKR